MAKLLAMTAGVNIIISFIALNLRSYAAVLTGTVPIANSSFRNSGVPTVLRGGSRGAGGPGPSYFWQSQFNFLHCIQCLKKIFLKLNLDFIVAEIRGVFGSVGVYV